MRHGFEIRSGLPARLDEGPHGAIAHINVQEFVQVADEDPVGPGHLIVARALAEGAAVDVALEDPRRVMPR